MISQYGCPTAQQFSVKDWLQLLSVNFLMDGGNLGSDSIFQQSVTIKFSSDVRHSIFSGKDFQLQVEIISVCRYLKDSLSLGGFI